MKINDNSSILTLDKQDKDILNKLAHYIIYENGIKVTELEEDVGLTEDEYKRLRQIHRDYLYFSGYISG
jgi:hypothetical protein